MDRMTKKTRLIIAACLLLVVACIYFSRDRLSSLLTAYTAKVVQPSCSNGKDIHKTLSASNNSLLKKLSQYETTCHGAVVDELTIFVAMPKSADEAQRVAHDTSVTLHEFASQDIRPLVLFEPDVASETVVADAKSGIYDSALADYFNALKLTGLSDEQMGTWVLFPEANTPAWHNTDPTDFTDNVTKVATIQKQVFPASKVSILLNSRTYPSDDSEWNYGELKSLLPYVKDIPTGIVDSLGYQGFPSVSAADAPSKYSQLTSKDFLPSRLATEAAKQMGVHEIWLNTGTFNRMYTEQPKGEVRMSATQRQGILDGVLEEMKKIKAQQYDVSVNLFAADKSDMSEHIDWSYWPSDKPGVGADADVLKKFVAQLRSTGSGFSLYDESK